MSFYWESTVFAIIAFGILYFLLQKFAFGPLFGIMEKRQNLIQDNMKQAELSRTEAAKLLEEQKQAIQDARKEAYEMMEQAKQMSSKQADEILRQAREEALRLKEDAQKQIETEKLKAISELREQVGAISLQIASKIIEKQVDAQAQQQIVDQYLKEVGQSYEQ